MHRLKLVSFLVALLMTVALGVRAEDGPAERQRAFRGLFRPGDLMWESSKTTPLVGDWAFYWQRLLDPDLFDHDSVDLLPEPDAYIDVPGSWNDYHPSAQAAPKGFGYATYHLRIELPELMATAQTPLALYVSWLPSAYRMWIDGTPVASNGTVSTSPTESDAHVFPRLIPFVPVDKTVDIVLHISNYEHRFGGLWNAPILGTYAELSKVQQRRSAFDAALAGALGLLALYHIALYVWVGRSVSSLYLASSAALFALRALVTREQLLARFFEGLPWTLAVRTEYLTGYLFIVAFFGFLRSTFPDECSKRAAIGAQAFGLAGAAAAALLPVSVGSALVPALTPVFALLNLYAAWIFVKAVRNGRDGALLSLPGGIALTATLAHDLTHYNVPGFSTELWPAGVLILVLSESLTVARQFALVVRRERELAEENRRLLQEAAERLKELQHSRRLIAQHDESLRRSISERLHSGTQNRLLRALLRLDTAHANLTTDPASAAVLIRAAQEDVEHVRTVDIRRISHQLHPSVVKAGMIAAVTSLADQFADACTIQIDADDACRSRDTLDERGLSESLRLAVYRVVEEALGNIQAHAQAKNVRIELRCIDEHLILVIQDDGRGFSPAKTKHNLGLSIIDAAVTNHGGSWTLESAPGQGVRITCRLPIEIRHR